MIARPNVVALSQLRRTIESHAPLECARRRQQQQVHAFMLLLNAWPELGAAESE